jgi:hypothetical protein
MWIRNEDRNGQKVLDEVEIDGTLWVEIPDEKGDEDDVFAKNRTRAGKEIIPAQNELCKS